jgi:7 transmembrane receptor (Secretin family)/GPCR proteolysis site, GPS, motif
LINLGPGLCVFWDLTAANGGNWSTEGCELKTSHEISKDTILDECHCWHMTHFGALFFNKDQPLPAKHEYNLELMSKIGCIISLVALCGIFVTAAISHQWLQGAGQKILLQMAISLALLMGTCLIPFYVEIKSDSVECFALGFVLHYTILSNFLWMAVAGYLQYYRLVKVLYRRTLKLIFKSCIFGWGVPIIPGALVLISAQFQVYSQSPLCLPVGWLFYVTTLFPLCVILVFNLIVFSLIIRNLFSMQEPRKHVDKRVSLLRVKQLAFLFTLLGLNWGFAVGQVVFQQWRVVFAYLFCVFIAFQGVTYFVFFVLLHEKAMKFWKVLLCGSDVYLKFNWSSSSTKESEVLYMKQRD